MIEDSGVTPVCCGEEMEELLPGMTDGAKEKHIPVCTKKASIECMKEQVKETLKDQEEKSFLNDLIEKIFTGKDPDDRKRNTASASQLLTVTVGELPHPMEKAHHISWVVVETTKGIYRKDLTDHKEPQLTFLLTNDEQVKAIYSYCNLHGLWVNVTGE